MGACTKKICSEMGITRESYDEYAIRSYNKARKAQEQGILDLEIVDVIEDNKGKEKKISKDEEC